MMLRIKFFASLRDSLNTSELELEYSPELGTTAQLRLQLQMRDPIWKKALANASLLVAVNQQMAPADTVLKDGDEVAFFPPVTGG